MELQKSAEKYRVTEDFRVQGRLCLIIGAAGDAGGHFAVGMPGSAGCDVVLTDLSEYKDEMKEILRDIGTAELPVKVYTEFLDQPQEPLSLIRTLEKKYGQFACILDVERINITHSFPESMDIVQKPVKSRADLKPRYQIGQTFTGKTVLVLGAGGNWGTHMAHGMAAADADLILVDTPEHADAVIELTKIIGDSVSVCTEFVSAGQLSDRDTLLKDLINRYGLYDALLDVRGINHA